MVPHIEMAVQVGSMEVDDVEIGVGRLVETGLIYLQYYCIMCDSTQLVHVHVSYLFSRVWLKASYLCIVETFRGIYFSKVCHIRCTIINTGQGLIQDFS